MFFSIGSGGDVCEVVEDSRVPSRSVASLELVPSSLSVGIVNSCGLTLTVTRVSPLCLLELDPFWLLVTMKCVFRSAISVSLSCASPFLNVSVFIQPKMAAGSGKGWQSWDTSSSSWDEHVWKGKKWQGVGSEAKGFVGVEW